MEDDRVRWSIRPEATLDHTTPRGGLKDCRQDVKKINSCPKYKGKNWLKMDLPFGNVRDNVFIHVLKEKSSLQHQINYRKKIKKTGIQKT